ncbi:hypothetical protein GCM10023339_22790 [Alloalcanivorax gelatiniphagus]
MKGGAATRNLPEGEVMVDEKKIEMEMERRRFLADRNVADVVGLLQRRQELRGVYPAADLVADNVGWVV